MGIQLAVWILCVLQDAHNWINSELLGLLKTRREVDQRWKSGQIPTGNDKAVARGCRDAAGIAKAQLKLKLTRNVKNSKKWFFRYVESKWKKKENIGPLLYGRGELVTSNAERAAVLDTSFTSVFTNTAEPQAFGAKFHIDANTN